MSWLTDRGYGAWDRHALEEVSICGCDRRPKRIESKQDYYKLAKAGYLGNTIRQWDPDAFAHTLHAHPGTLPGRVAVRGMEPASKKYQGYNLTHVQAMRRCREAEKRGLTALIDEQAPDHRSVIKGEVMREEHYLYVRYDDTPGLRMREAYPKMKHLFGLAANTLLSQRMDASSWDCLNRLLDEYPDSIIEFTVYDHTLGRFGWNTIFWEVRNY